MSEWLRLLSIFIGAGASLYRRAHLNCLVSSPCLLMEDFMKRKEITSAEEKESNNTVAQSRKDTSRATFAYWSPLRLRQATPIPIEVDQQESDTQHDKEDVE